MRIEAPAGIENLTEAQFQKLVVHSSTMMGWKVEHFPNMVVNPSGFPDLALWKNDNYLLIELKREGGKERPKQIEWREEAAYFGVTVHLIQPSDWEYLMDLLEDGG